MKYFKNVNCVEELKKQYFGLAKKYHSDITKGNDNAMTEINNEYEVLFKKYKNIHRNTKEDVKSDTYEDKKGTSETPEDFKTIILTLLNLNVDIELCGRWLWISGNTKNCKDELKKLNCKWSPAKQMWSWHFDKDSTHYSKKRQTMDYIRGKYGSVKFEKEPTLALN